MSKDYRKWTEQKVKIHNDKIRPFLHEREVWFSSIGENIGFEQDGGGGKFMRPVLVLKKFNNEVAWVLPLTRTDKAGKYYFHISLVSDDEKTNSQPEDEFLKIKEALIALLK